MIYDQLVLGNGRDAVSAALSGARTGLRVALAVPADTPSDWVSAKVLRQAVDRLIPTGYVSMSALRREVGGLIDAQRDADRNELSRWGVERFTGQARLVSADSVVIGDSILRAGAIVLACGTRTAPFGHVPFDGQIVLAAEQLLAREELPRSMIVVGAGESGLEHAVVLATLGVRTTVVDDHVNMFDLCGGLMRLPLFEAQAHDIAFRLGDEVICIEPSDRQAVVRLASGRLLKGDAVLVCTGREGRTDGLDLESVGVGLDERGRVWCDARGRTWNPQISAVGDVVGFRTNHIMAG